MIVAELRVALADLPGDTWIDVIHSIQEPACELREFELVVLVNQREPYVIITTKVDQQWVEKNYDFIPRRKHSE